MSQEPALKALTDQCVKCGLCLPHCPTYGLSRNEGDSPRGRVALIQGLIDESLPPSPRMLAHLDTCLGCRACERVCPAGVQFGRIMDAGRAELVGRAPGYGRGRVSRLFVRRGARRVAAPLLRLAQRLGLTRAGRRLPGIPGRLAGLLAPTSRPFRVPAEPAGNQPVDVMLFTGCVQSVVDGQTLEDTIEVLTAAGYRVGVPPEQDCCGALPAHAGDPATAARLAAVNRSAFGAGDERVVCLATGCSEQLLQSDPKLNARVVPVEALVLPRLDRLPTGPLPGLALLHRPCTQPPDVGGRSPARDMLAAIPDLTVQELPGNDRCCGAAGDHPIRHPAQADALAAPKVAAARQAEARWLATTNIGCMLHLGRALAHDPEVLHPVSLLARSLRAGRCSVARDMAK